MTSTILDFLPQQFTSNSLLCAMNISPVISIALLGLNCGISIIYLRYKITIVELLLTRKNKDLLCLNSCQKLTCNKNYYFVNQMAVSQTQNYWLRFIPWLYLSVFRVQSRGEVGGQ